MKSSLHDQALAVDVAHVQARRRGNPAMKPKEWAHIEDRLAAACMTLRLLDANRHRLPEGLISELEGDAR